MSVICIPTKAMLDKELSKAGERLVVIDFSAIWCGPCRSIETKVEAMAQEMENVVFLNVDVDENQETAASYNIRFMPTFVFYKNGKKAGEFSGADLVKLRSIVNSFLV